MSIPLSVALITYNEADRLEPVLEALRWCNNVVVVDSGSTDDTVRLAEKYGAQVIQRKFDGFGQQKQAAVNACRNNWVLSLDSDEVMSVELVREIHLLFEKEEPELKAWYVQRRLVFLNTVFRYGKEARDRQLRLFHREHAAWNHRPVHEAVEYSGKKGILKAPLLHYSYRNLTDYITKSNRYTSLAALELAETKKGRSSLMNFLSLPINWFKFYILQLNFMNGPAGLVWSVLCAWYTYIKHVKASETE